MDDSGRKLTNKLRVKKMKKVIVEIFELRRPDDGIPYSSTKVIESTVDYALVDAFDYLDLTRLDLTGVQAIEKSHMIEPLKWLIDLNDGELITITIKLV